MAFAGRNIAKLGVGVKGVLGKFLLFACAKAADRLQ
jgi:hypothetical protein